MSAQIPERGSFLRKLIGNTIVGLGGTVLQKGLTFATTLILARGLGDEGFGLYSYVVAYIFLFAFLSDLGIDLVVTREVARAPDQAGQILGSAVLLKLASSALAFVLAAGTAYRIDLPQEARYCVVLAALGMPLSIERIFRAYFQSRYEVKVGFGATLPGTAAFLAVAAVCVHLKLPVYALFVAMLVIGVLTLARVLSVSLPHIRLSLSPRWPEILTLLRDSWEVGLFVFLFIVTMRVDQVMLYHLRSANDVGLYAAVVRVSEALSIVPDALLLTLFPLLVRTEQTAPERFRHTYRLGFKYLAALIVPIALALTLLRRDVVGIAFGPTYEGAASALAILAWNMFFAYTGAIYLHLFIAQARQRLLLAVSTVAVVVNVVCNLLWIPAYGAAGAAVATVVANFAGFLCWCLVPVTRPYMLVCLGESWRPAVVAAAVLVVLWVLPLSPVASTVVMLGLFPLGLWALGGVGWSDVVLVQRLFAHEDPSTAPATPRESV